jgi:DNA repair photolyase
VNLSVTTLDAKLARALEPRTSAPAARLRAIGELSGAGVPVRVMAAPVIPGLNDSEIPAILQAAAEAGAKSANFVLLRLPYAVKPIFLDWLARERPLAAPKVEQLLRSMRGGELSATKFGERMRGTGPIAEQIEAMFQTFRRRHALDQPLPEFDFSQFSPPITNGQLRLF